jgi:hypothetical protein
MMTSEMGISVDEAKDGGMDIPGTSVWKLSWAGAEKCWGTFVGQLLLSWV